jgi:lauroyl/myristoyl acyltransferase
MAFVPPLPPPLDQIVARPAAAADLARDALRHPKDAARWAFWVPLRGFLDPRHPGLLRALGAFWHAAYRTGGAQRARMEDEYRRIFGGSLDEAALGRIVADAWRIMLRVSLEELVLGKLEAATVGGLVDLRGLDGLDRVLSERKKGAILLSAHAGSFMLPIAALSLRGYPYTQYAARGLAPGPMAREHPEALPTNAWFAATMNVKEANEDRLPARFLTLRSPTREIYQRLGRNEIVAMAFDGRLGSRFVRTPFLGREALLHTGPYRLAASTGAAIVPVLCHTPRDGPSVCDLGLALVPDGRSWPELMQDFVTGRVGPWILEHPSEYGTWLAHCRLHAAIDDHPLFADQADHERWRRYPRLEDCLSGTKPAGTQRR